MENLLFIILLLCRVMRTIQGVLKHLFQFPNTTQCECIKQTHRLSRVDRNIKVLILNSQKTTNKDTIVFNKKLISINCEMCFVNSSASAQNTTYKECNM